jgi:hypothetical protein
VQRGFAVRRAVVVCALCSLAASARAWDGFGHMTVAAIAYPRLSPVVRAKVDGLLRRNPQYSSWIADVARTDVGLVAFVKASRWADEIKTMPGYKNDGERPHGALAGLNIGYADRLQHRYWHFIDNPFSPDGTPLLPPAAPNLRTQIALLRRTLSSVAASDEVKSYDLVWLLHLVGDAHQPLHAASRFTHDLPRGDNGGNRIALCSRPCRDELHLFWDKLPGRSTKAERAIRVARTLASADPTLAMVLDERVWIDESFRAAQNEVYRAPIGLGAGPYALDTAYRLAAKKLARQRIALAGARLANLLNEALK